VDELINMSSTNIHLNKPDSVLSFTEEKEVEKEMGERGTDDSGEKLSPLPVTLIQQQKYLI
jgi:hypothetical protein